MNRVFKNIRIHSLHGFVSIVVVCIVTASCGPSRINYDPVYFRNGADTVLAALKETVIQSNDILNIQVFSKTSNQEQAAIFNLANASNGTVTGFQVSASGNIQMPLLGAVNAAKLTKLQLQESLEQKLTPYVKNPSVLVRFLQFNVNVLGEVKVPGIQRFASDRVTVIDALSAAGDLTDYGKREDVMVIRETDGKKIYYKIDLRSKELFQSPVYVLQPNDVVYVAPTQSKLKTLSVDPDSQRKTGLFFTVISLTITVATFVITTLK